MRLAVITGAVLALLVVSAAGGAAGKPTLRLVQASPVAVAGSGFGPTKRVTVIYESRSKVVTSTRAGSFRVTFDTQFSRCKGASLAARSVVGSVTVQLLPCSVLAGKPRILFGFGSAGTVTGLGFLPGERVQVAASADAARASAAGNADGQGHFALRLALPAVACAEVFVRATGSLGSSATYTRPAPDCKSP